MFTPYGSKFFQFHAVLGEIWQNGVGIPIQRVALADPRGHQGHMPPRGLNSFIFMQFSAKKLKNNSTFGSCRILLGEGGMFSSTVLWIE